MKTLALSTKVSNGVKPPATKREIINAMVIVKHQQLIAARDKHAEEYAEFQAKLKADIAAHALASISKLSCEAHLGYGRSGGRVTDIEACFTLEFENLPKSLQKDLLKFHSMKSYIPIPEMSKIRADITAQMAGHTTPDLRVQALVETPETRKALEKMLATIEKGREIDSTILI